MIKESLLECPSDGKCNINANTRKLCPKCRLHKCLAVGMKKEYILGDEEREQRRQLVAENRRKRKQLSESQNTSSEANEPSNPRPLESTISSDCGDSDFLDDIMGCVLDEHSDHSIETLKDRHKLEDINEKSQKIAVIPLFKELTDYNSLNELEINKIGELLNTSKIFDYPSTKNIIKLKDKSEYVRLYSQRTEDIVKELLNYSKGLNGFSRLCDEDQYTIFKYGCSEMLLMRSLYSTQIDPVLSTDIMLDIYYSSVDPIVTQKKGYVN
ncbi:unnamed protein product [Oppiella nova]|uniref:Nuclear receptor domain-containing protein n=1 Tax=Oppiella nova TaxID=334625 RepID=A0A7R9LEM1_9ACAR|nr:unnamed protein product [Oppiella nova]CAG2162068.1 unnamed protein product [Oppiella nova]